jgi:hypothetical protein
VRLDYIINAYEGGRGVSRHVNRGSVLSGDQPTVEKSDLCNKRFI